MVTLTLLPKERFHAGDQLGAYTLLERIGVGGQAVIWSAWDHRYERVVAIKIFTAGEPDLPSASMHFEREAHLVASLSHPHILPLYETGLADGHPYFVMRYASRGSLIDLLRHGPIPPADTLHLLAQIASALEYIHERRIVHRDLKPGNVLLDSRQHAYLGDFGLARRIEQITALLHTGRGTVPYAPPEQHIRAPMTPKSDIYSLGVLIFEMLTGTLPWHGDTSLALQQLHEGTVLPDPAEINPALPPTLAPALRTLTAADPAERPASAFEAVHMVAQALQDEDALDRFTQHPAVLAAEGDLLVVEDARTLLAQALAKWDADRGPFEMSLTHFVLVNTIAAHAERYNLPLDEATCLFMLRGALVHGHHIDFWWRKVDDVLARLRLCEQVLAHEGEAVVGRLLTLLLGEPAGSFPAEQLSLGTLERLIALAAEAESATLRRDALALLGRAVGPQSGLQAARWRSVAFSPAADAQLAALALGEHPLADEAARLIGRVCSEQAVRELIKAQGRAAPARLHAALVQVQRVAGSLPSVVPPLLRLRTTAERIRRRLSEEYATLSWVRALIGLAAGALIGLAMARGAFAALNLQMRDILLQPYPTSGVLTIVSIDDSSLERYGRWENWPRSLHAALIDRLHAAGARAIVFDITFASPSADDALLAEAMRRAGNVVQPVLGQGSAILDTPGAARYMGGVWPHLDLTAASAALGHTNVLHDVDGYVRRMPTVIVIDGVRYPSLPLVAVHMMLGTDPSTVPQAEDGLLRTAGREIPVGRAGDMLIHYAGPPQDGEVSTFPVVRYEDVLDGRADPDLFRGKIVLVGVMATAEPDRYLTPVSRRGLPMYGVEVLANAIETIWSGRFIHLPPLPAEVAILLALGLLTALIDVRPWLGLALTIGEGMVYVIIASLLFDQQGLMLSLLYPLLTILLSYTMTTAYRLSVEVRYRRAVMRLFEARVTPEVARAALRAIRTGAISLSGDVQQVTALAAVVRGYGRHAELHGGQAAQEMLDRLVGILSESIFVYEGTLVQVGRDQVVAIFNAPIPQPDHALRAVRAALEAQHRLRLYHEGVPADHPHRAVGFACGVHTGQAIVGLGGAGAWSPAGNRPQSALRAGGRREYTAAGEAISLALRLADAAQMGQVLIASSTRERIADVILADPLPPIAVREQTVPLAVFAVQQPLAEG